MRVPKYLVIAGLMALNGCVQSTEGTIVQEEPVDLGQSPHGNLWDLRAERGEDAGGIATETRTLDDLANPLGDLPNLPADVLQPEDGGPGPSDLQVADTANMDIAPEVIPSCPDNALCDDGDPCTSGESCSAGNCIAAAVNLTIPCLYTLKPNIHGCEAGITSGSARSVALAQVNRLRALSGLPAVAYDSGSDVETSDAALMMIANNALSHTPPDTWHCWTDEGFAGAGASNLHRGWSTDLKLPDPLEAVNAFLVDIDVESLGHRRWLLDPFLTKISYSASHGKPKVPSSYSFARAMALKVIYPNPKPVQIEEQFVAYPYGDYPSSLVNKNWYLSFSMIANTVSKWDNEKVGLANAKVSVFGPGQNSLQVHSLESSNEFFGLPNHLQWKVNGLQEDVTYKVSVTGLDYGGKSHSFQYLFKLVP
jgi:hypothetical protein